MLNSVVNAAVAQSAKAPVITTSGATCMQRQCTCGNHTSSGGECATCAKKKLQKKLSIGATNDPLEVEADRVADQVLAYQPTHSFSNFSAPKIQRRAEQSSPQSEEVPASVERVLAGSGSPLPPTVRMDMEQRFGQDFSRVRVHSDVEAHQSARDVNAHAYTVGRDIVFAEGRYAPDMSDGRRLLAHEMVHVVQQTIAPISAPLLQKKGGFPKTVTVDTAQVNVTSKAEEDEARTIVADIKQRFDITFDEQKGLKVIRDKVVADSEHVQDVNESISKPGAPKKKVKDLLDTSVWTLAKLRDLRTGLTFFAPVLGPQRTFSNRTGKAQELTTVSRLKVGLNDARKDLNEKLQGDYFELAKHAAFYDSAGVATALADKKKAFLGNVVHEVAHAMLGSNSAQFVSGLSPPFWKDENTPTNDPKAESPVTRYGETNAGEDLAEAVMFYFVEPATLQKKRLRYDIVDKFVKNLAGPPGPSPLPQKNP